MRSGYQTTNTSILTNKHVQQPLKPRNRRERRSVCVLRSHPPGRACSGSKSHCGRRRARSEVPAASAGSWDKPQPQQLPKRPRASLKATAAPRDAEKTAASSCPDPDGTTTPHGCGGGHFTALRMTYCASCVPPLRGAAPPPVPGACAARRVAAEPGQPAQRRGGGGGGGGWRQSAQLMNGTGSPGPSF